MNCECRNYYKTGRENAGFTQEYASMLLNICVRSLSDYENGRTIPTDEVVEKMVDAYGTKLLGWWHLRNTSELARKCLPDIQPPQTNADLYMQIDFSEDDISAAKTMIKKLLKDGRITENELPEYEKMREKVKITAGKLMSIYTYEPKVETK